MTATAISTVPTAPAAAIAGSFVDAYGATVSIPAGEAADYAGVRAEQLQCLTQLLTNHQIGGINLGGALEVIQLMANEFAHNVHNLIDIVADDQEGGA